MADISTSETQPLLGEDEPPREVRERQGWREWTGTKLESRRFHSFVLILVLVDCICVLLELSFLLLDACTGAQGRPVWVKIASYLSMTISCIFILEIPSSLFAFGPEWYWPWSDVKHSTFHLFDATVIVVNFVIVFLEGPGEELASLLILLRLWRLVKLLGGVATGVEGYNEEVHRRLACAEKELAEKVQRLDEANRTIDDLRRRLDASQP